MKRHGCIDCHLIEPIAGQWIRGRCPACAELARQIQAAPAATSLADDATAKRLTGYLKMQADRFPGLWRDLDAIRQTPAWPPYVFVPSRRWINLLRLPPAEISTLPPLAAWRPTQGIYRFDPDVIAALWDTPVDGMLPSEVIRSLPEWCVYIDSAPPGCVNQTTARTVLGYWAWLDWDKTPQTEVDRLYFALDDGRFVCTLLPIALTESGMLAGIERSRREAARVDLAPEDRTLVDAPDVDLAAKLIGPVLYLCSVNAELRTRKEGLRPSRPKGTKTKDGMRVFPPHQPTLWGVGWRTGAAIRAARDQEYRRPGDGTHASPRPHIRRAHWHSFWTGPKAKIGIARDQERKLQLKWLPPIPVNVEEDAPVIPTIHGVAGKGV